MLVLNNELWLERPEEAQIVRSLAPFLIQTKRGYFTHVLYEFTDLGKKTQLDTLLFKGQPYSNTTATRTASVTSYEYLRELSLTLDIENSILTTQDVEFLPVNEGDMYIVVGNLPVINMKHANSELYIIGIMGYYDIETGLFKGSLTFGTTKTDNEPASS